MNFSDANRAIHRQMASIKAELPLSGVQVLLAEDCLDQGRLYLNFLEAAGAEVALECNGKSTVDAVRKSMMKFDIVVMDFEMPELDGIEATRQLRALGYSGAIIAMTAFATQELKTAWILAGCDEFLLKPIKKNEIINAVVSHARAQKCVAR